MQLPVLQIPEDRVFSLVFFIKQFVLIENDDKTEIRRHLWMMILFRTLQPFLFFHPQNSSMTKYIL